MNREPKRLGASGPGTRDFLDGRECGRGVMLSFRPHPLLRSGHLQTVFGAMYPGRLPPYQATPREVLLADGERLIVHVEPARDCDEAAPLVILIHGLGGDHSSPYLRRIASSLVDSAARVWRVDMRGCGAGLKHGHRPAHAGCSHDLAAIVAAAQQAQPRAPIALAAFSLGGNILLKMLGELAAGGQHPEVDAARLSLAMAVAPPSDILACSMNMERFSRLPYTRYYLKMLAAQVQQRAAHWEQWRRITPPGPPRTIRQFDQIYTAPLAGFSSAEDYYARSSSARWLSQITVPTRLLIDRDDPIIPARTFDAVELSPHIIRETTRHGGHLGYLARRPGSGAIERWMDRWVVDVIQDHFFRAPHTHSLASHPPHTQHVAAVP
jgi:uncharacterized protein